MNATTQLETVNVNAQKDHVLGNQQPSTCKMVKVQRPGDIPHRFQVGPKREAAAATAEDMVFTVRKRTAVNLTSPLRYYMVFQANPKRRLETMKKISVELVERFSEKWELNTETGCWEWTASMVPRGYGQIKDPGTRANYIAHRLSYLIHYGEIPTGMCVCHTCDNPKCVRPTHLFLGTKKDNNQDAAAKGRSTMHNAKLTEEKVLAIHKMAEEGVSQGKIGRNFGVGQATIWKILHGERWKKVYSQVKTGTI